MASEQFLQEMAEVKMLDEDSRRVIFVLAGKGLVALTKERLRGDLSDFTEDEVAGAMRAALAKLQRELAE